MLCRAFLRAKARAAEADRPESTKGLSTIGAGREVGYDQCVVRGVAQAVRVEARPPPGFGRRHPVR